MSMIHAITAERRQLTLAYQTTNIFGMWHKREREREKEGERSGGQRKVVFTSRPF